MPRAAAAAAALLCLGWARLAAGLHAPRSSGFLSIEEMMLHHGGRPPIATNSTASPAGAYRALMLQVQYELELGHPDQKPKAKDKRVLAVIMGLNLGWTGLDRCFFGQFTIGVLKGFTCGGCCVMAFVDTVLILINIFQMADSMDVFYMKATWEKDSIDQALYIWAFLFIINIIASRQDRTQAEGQAMCRRRLGSQVAGEPSSKEVFTLFRAFDEDQNGSLDPEELRKALKYLGVADEDYEAYANLIDKNHDGKIDINEFAEALDKGVLKIPAEEVS